MQVFWRNFLTGIFVVLPAALTIIILEFLFGWVFHLVVNPFAHWLTPWISSTWAFFLVRAGVVAGFILTLALLGFATRILVIRRLLYFAESLIGELPMVGKIYGMIRHVADAFGGGERGAFTRVVLLEWPRKGLYVLGFVTSEGEGEVQKKTPEHVIHVFVPHAPNPTSGFFLMVDKEILIDLDMTVEEGLKLVVSGGVVGPSLTHARMMQKPWLGHS